MTSFKQRKKKERLKIMSKPKKKERECPCNEEDPCSCCPYLEQCGGCIIEASREDEDLEIEET